MQAFGFGSAFHLRAKGPGIRFIETCKAERLLLLGYFE